jgi:ParB-like chromosome segregation protein Spo0J
MTGRHRLEAAKRLGWEKVECIVHNEGDEVDAELWEIAENLHRAELTALERDEQIARWAELAARRVSDKLSETGKAKGGRPGIAAKAAKELGVDERAVQRAVRVASLSDEAKAVARETGLADNRTALLDAAKRPTPAEQVEAIRQRAAPKAVKLADDPLNNLEAREKQVAALMAAWNRASKEAREEFLSRVDSPVMDASRRHA